MNNNPTGINQYTKGGRSASSIRRGYKTPGAKMTPKFLGTPSDVGRVAKKAYNREHKVGGTLRSIATKAMFQERKGKLISASGRTSQLPRLERKEALAVKNRQKIGAWKSPHTYSLPKGTPMAARRSVRNGATQQKVVQKYMTKRK